MMLSRNALTMFLAFGDNDHPNIRRFLNDPQDAVSP
jgi:hypothetical protein